MLESRALVETQVRLFPWDSQVRLFPWDSQRLHPAPQALTWQERKQDVSWLPPAQSRPTFASSNGGFALSVHVLSFPSLQKARPGGVEAVKIKGVIYELSCSSSSKNRSWACSVQMELSGRLGAVGEGR